MAAYAIEGAYRRIGLIDTGQLSRSPWTSRTRTRWSSSSARCCWSFSRNRSSARRAGSKSLVRSSSPISGYTLLATERRAGYIAVIVAFLAFALVLLMAQRKAFFLLAVPVLICGAIYVPVFWNNTSLLGQPARAIRSLSEPDPRDAASNLYRDLEKINVRATIQAEPAGSASASAASSCSWRRCPTSRGGRSGTTSRTTTSCGSGSRRGSSASSPSGCSSAARWRARRTSRGRLQRPEARVFAIFALTGIISTVVFCYVDLGLVSGRVTVFLGTLLGTLSVLDQLRDSPSEPHTSCLRNGSHARLGCHLHSQPTRPDRHGGGERAGQHLPAFRPARGRPERRCRGQARSSASWRRRIRTCATCTPPTPGLSRAYNIGVRETQGEVLAFTDDDCVAPPDWIAVHRGRLRGGARRRHALRPGAAARRAWRDSTDDRPDAAPSSGHSA